MTSMHRAFIAFFAVMSLSAARAEDQIIEGRNGETYRITRIDRSSDGCAIASIIPPNGPATDVKFDCHGHMTTYSLDAQAFGPSRYIPPRGVFAKIEQIACEHGRIEQ
jgi:hypothetical protein